MGAKRCEAAARSAAEAHLATLDMGAYLEQAKTASNSALLVLYQDGAKVVDRLAQNDIDGDKSPAAPPADKKNRAEAAPTNGDDDVTKPAKVAYMPAATINGMLGVEIPSFTFSKQHDIVVVVVLCGLSADGEPSPESVFHATFVYHVEEPETAKKATEPASPRRRRK